jgi:hypothetical protein
MSIMREEMNRLHNGLIAALGKKADKSDLKKIG